MVVCETTDAAGTAFERVHKILQKQRMRARYIGTAFVVWAKSAHFKTMRRPINRPPQCQISMNNWL